MSQHPDFVTGDERTGTGRPTHFGLVESLRVQARELRSEAHRVDALADKVENPPDGVRVEYDGRNTVRFVGPTVEVRFV